MSMVRNYPTPSAPRFGSKPTLPTKASPKAVAAVGKVKRKKY